MRRMDTKGNEALEGTGRSKGREARPEIRSLQRGTQYALAMPMTQHTTVKFHAHKLGVSECAHKQANKVKTRPKWTHQ